MESGASHRDEDDSLMHDVTKLGDSAHRVKPSCSSPKDSSNKENINVNKSEMQKNVEHLQKKRKKKGGGYNLRKSLAWDRAFFTEEGVLDPVELSMITGTNINSGGMGLSVISEEGSDLISGDCQFPINSPNLQSHQGKKNSRKLLTSHGGSGTGLKAGRCPRPLPSSSLKRPAILNAGRSVTKESKFPKTSIPKPGSSSFPVTSKSTMHSGSSLKRNQIVQQAIKNQKTLESKIPTNVKNIPNLKAGCATMMANSSSKHSKAVSPVKIPSSTNICSQLVKKEDKTCSNEMPKNVVLLGTSCSKEVRPTLFIASACQNISTAGSSMHHGQIQVKKPSGLRMPSPSLGFFGESKASVSNNSTQISSSIVTPRLCKFPYPRPVVTHGLCNYPDPRPSQLSYGKPKTWHDIMASLNARLLSSRTECSSTSDYNAASDVTGLLHQTGVCKHLKVDDVKNETDGFQRSNDSNYSSPEDSLLMSQKMSPLGDPLERENLCDSAVTNLDSIHALQLGVVDSGREQSSLIRQSNKEMYMRSCYQSSNDQTDLSKQLQSGVTDNGREQNSLTRQSHKEMSIQSCYQSSSDQTDLSEQSERHVEAERMSPEVEQRSYNHAGDCLLLEKYQHVKEMEVLSSIIPNGGQVDTSMDKIFQAPDEVQVGTFHRDRQILLNGQPSKPVETAPLVDTTGCLPSRNLNCDVFLKDESTAVDFDSSLSEQLYLVDADTKDLFDSKDMHSMNIDRLNSDLAVEELRCQTLSDSLHKVSQNIEMNDSFSPGKRLPDESNPSLIVQDHLEGELKRSIYLPYSIHMVPDSIEQIGDEIVQSIIGSAPANCCIRHTSLVHNYERSEQQQLVNPDITATTDSKSNKILQRKDRLLIEKCSISGQSLEKNISGGSGGALPQKADVYRCESRSLSDVSGVLCSLEETCNNSNKFHSSSFLEGRPPDFACVKDAHLENVVIEPLPEGHGLLVDTQINCDLQFMEEAKSPECSSDSRTNGDNKIHTSCAEHFSLGGNIGLSTAENSLRGQQDFDGVVRYSLAFEDNSKSLREIDTSACELHHELYNGPCLTTDNNPSEMIKKSEKDVSKNNLRITLPRDMVPFSEEWLAAIEAAGEDILTLKTGAVQNSPPDKSLPEPSPWSPVRRRNNQIGPYDCTKFTNNAPSDS